MDPRKKSFRKMPFYSRPVDKIKEKFRYFQNMKENLKDMIPAQYKSFKLSPKQKFTFILVVGAIFTVKTLRSIYKLSHFL